MSTNVGELVMRAKQAQQKFSSANQVQVDAVVKAVGRVVFDNAEELAQMAVAETGMGVLADKISKNKGKSSTIWYDLRKKKSVDIIGRDEQKGLVYVAKPVGVVGSITPCTNPIVTPMSNAMFALKGRNAIIVSPHPKAVKCSIAVVEMFRTAIAGLGVPADLIQIIPEASIEASNELMRAVDLVVATGGMGMVKAAYSSGKPSLGVGAGNVQCIIDKDVELHDVAQKVIAGRKFDNGIICSGEQSIIVPEDRYGEAIAVFEQEGAYFVKDMAVKTALRQAIFVDGKINRAVVGQSVQKIAAIAGIKVPEAAKVIIIEADGCGTADVLCKEKMCPVMIALKYKTFTEAVAIAKVNLEVEGQGHTCALHSHNTAHIEYAGERLPISRLIINQPSSTTAGGSFHNGLAPTTTLGCGSWGNNSMSENITYKHFINVSRIAYYIDDVKIPSMEELWS